MAVDFYGARVGTQARYYWVQVCGTSGKPRAACQHMYSGGGVSAQVFGRCAVIVPYDMHNIVVKFSDIHWCCPCVSMSWRFRV